MHTEALSGGLLTRKVTMASNDGNSPAPFAAVLRARLAARDEFLTNTGNINWKVVADKLPGVHYETLRKAVAGDRPPTAGLMEALAALLGEEPTIFAEYQLWLVQREFDVREVGWESAMQNLHTWASKRRR